MIVAASASFASEARAQTAEEAAVKATFLYRFASFVDWPSAAFAALDSPLVICVSGADGFAHTVQQASSGGRIGGRPVEVRAVTSVGPGSGCHIVFLAGVATQSVAEGVRALRGQPVLTVTDDRNGGARGAIHFVVADGRVRFHVDRDQAQANGLAINARLLNIALSVRHRGP